MNVTNETLRTSNTGGDTPPVTTESVDSEIPRARCWVVSNGRPGTQNQALGIARALESRLAISIHVKQVVFDRPWRTLPFGLSGDPLKLLSSRGHLLRPPYPDLWIATGSDTVPLSDVIKKRSPRTYTIQTQNPRIALNRFDLVIPPSHDGIAGENVIPMVGAPSPLSVAEIDRAMAANQEWFCDLPAPRLAVMIGGNNRLKYLTVDIIERLGAQLTKLHDQGYSLVITSSRRTDRGQLAVLENALPKERVRIFDAAHSDATGFNPYPAMLSGVQAIIVTEESINMICEAAMTGLPVYTVRMNGKYGKFGQFHKTLRKRGIARTFDGTIDNWSYKPLQETDRIADSIASRIVHATNIHPLVG